MVYIYTYIHFPLLYCRNERKRERVSVFYVSIWKPRISNKCLWTQRNRDKMNMSETGTETDKHKKQHTQKRLWEQSENTKARISNTCPGIQSTKNSNFIVDVVNSNVRQLGRHLHWLRE